MKMFDRDPSGMITSCTNALFEFVNICARTGFDSKRVALAVFALLSAGVSTKTSFLGASARYISSTKRRDGGWSDTEETVLSISCLSSLWSQPASLKRSLDFLSKQRNEDGGWGRTKRDISRIPTTALLLYLITDFVDDKAMTWLQAEWQKDIFSSAPLSYKGGFFLLGLRAFHDNTYCRLIDETFVFIREQQNDDGGFGPWRNHPIGSDPWSTGVVLWGLSKWIDRVDPEVIERALSWLDKTQLPSGYWPYHYLDEGTSYALIGAVSAMKALAKLK